MPNIRRSKARKVKIVRKIRKLLKKSLKKMLRNLKSVAVVIFSEHRGTYFYYFINLLCKFSIQLQESDEYIW